MAKFMSLEQEALGLYHMSQNATAPQMIVELKTHGLINWEKCRTLVNDIDKMNIPANLKQKNALLKEYVELRIKSYELIYKALYDETDIYRSRIDSCGMRIEEIIQELSDR